MVTTIGAQLSCLLKATVSTRSRTYLPSRARARGSVPWWALNQSLSAGANTHWIERFHRKRHAECLVDIG